MGTQEGITATDMVSFDIKEIDGKKAFTALLKGTWHTLVTKDSTGKFEALTGFLSAIGVSSPVEKLAYKLYVTAMTEAICETVATIGDLLTSPTKQIIDSEIQKLPDIFTFNRESIDDPCGSDFYKSVESVISNCLDANSQIRFRQSLKKWFIAKLKEEWRDNTTKYQRLYDYLHTPFDTAGDTEENWGKYEEELEKLVTQDVFDEPYSLHRIYTPLNIYYCVNSPNETEEEKTHRIVKELDAHLDDWLSDGKDTYKAISGEPGSGKSTVAKMFAARRIKDMRVVYIPLDELNLKLGFRPAFDEYVKGKGLFANILDRGQKILIILDGLDELTEQGKLVAKTAYDFVYQVMKNIDSLNSRKQHIFILFTGRIPAMQESEGLFNDAHVQVLHLLPYYMMGKTKFDDYVYIDENKLLERDYRSVWWVRYAEAAGKSAEMPAELLEKGMIDLTSSPLLLHLVALYYAEKGNVPENRAVLYADLLEGVYNRVPKSAGRKKRSPLSKRFNSVDEYLDVLSDVAVAMWHNSDRKVTLAEARQYCKQNGHETLLNKLSDTDAEDGTANLFMTFYGRKAGKRGGEETFEFTHKSFGEYLVARRIVAEIKIISRDLKRLGNSAEKSRFSVADALDDWTELCGKTSLDPAQSDFIRAQVALCSQNSEPIYEWQKTLCILIETAVHKGLPFGKKRPETFKEELYIAGNTEVALLAAHSACGWATKKLVEIKWQNKYTADEWLRRLQDEAWCEIVNRHLNHLCLESCNFTLANFSRADLTGSRMEGEDIFKSTFMYADLSGATISISNIRCTIFNSTICENTVFTDVEFMQSSLSSMSLINAKLNNVSFHSTNFFHVDMTESLHNELELYDVPYGANTKK
jgi:hypothetical protein